MIPLCYSVNDVIARLGPQPPINPSQSPVYTGENVRGLMLAVESMREHMTDEGWQLALALQYQGYTLAGHNCTLNMTDVNDILSPLSTISLKKHEEGIVGVKNDIGVVVVQDKREWHVKPGNFRDNRAEFKNVGTLATNPNLFKLTVVKDAQHDPLFHKQSADEIGCHAWIVYYHPKIVSHLAPYIRPEHMIRTYHTLDSLFVPEYKADGRNGVLLSGAISGAYPLRRRLREDLGSNQNRMAPYVTVLPHPGYHRRGTATPQFLRTLSNYKVAICTASLYGYALRKIMEATACGCVVLTDLTYDEVLPGIDDNLIRVHPDTPTPVIRGLLRQACDNYEPERQCHYAREAVTLYDYRRIGWTLVKDIETQRRGYHVRDKSFPQDRTTKGTL